jgi:hypothetical protein
MANPARKKGTGGENEVRLLLETLFGRPFRRTHAGCEWDLETADGAAGAPLFVLATRPDYGRWLVSMDPTDWASDVTTRPIRVEVKRYARFAHHAIFEKKAAAAR